MEFKKLSELSRRLWVVAGERDAVSDVVREIVSGLEEGSLLVSDQKSDYAGLTSITYKQASNLLGQEKKLVVFDVVDQLHPDALAAVTGLIVGGGSLIITLPAEGKWSSYFKSNFSQRFIQFIQTNSFVTVVSANNGMASEQIKNSIQGALSSTDIELTADQIKVVEKISSFIDIDSKQALVVVSDRGRGKSTSLGVLAANLLTTKKIKILITAPRFKACEIAFDTVLKNIKGSKLQQASIQHENAEFTFMAPDEILRANIDADLLLVDEAASIPLPLLKQLLIRFNKTVYVSTVHGYEGTGRGFAVRFSKDLNDAVEQWHRIEMKTPVRWAVNDALESWLFKLLCLDADVPDINQDIDLDKIKLRQLSSADLMADESLLRQVFSLLVLAHYKTKPSDLQRLLDDDVTITVAEYDNNLLAVLLSANEGGFDSEMSSAIYQGVRRPKGNLLAQTLSYHCGVENAACANSHRIMRIVVHPQYQNKGLGSLLIEYLSNTLVKKDIDILGASFGLTDELSRFWQSNGFEIIRVGLKKEQSSGEHAALYVKPFSDKGEIIIADARQRFLANFPLLRKTVLKELSMDYLRVGVISNDDDISENELKDVESFVKYSRAYELCISAVDKWIKLLMLQRSNDNAVFKDVLNNVVFKKLSWIDVAKEMSLDGKKQAQSLFKQAVVDMWNEDE